MIQSKYKNYHFVVLRATDQNLTIKNQRKRKITPKSCAFLKFSKRREFPIQCVLENLISPPFLYRIKPDAPVQWVL